MTRTALVTQVEALRRRVKALERGRARSRRTEASLRESEGRFRALFEHASDLIIAAALDGSIIRVNRATEETLQWPREALIGRNIRELITPGSFALGEERMRRVLAGEKLPKIFGLEAIRRDGSVVPLEGWARLLRDARGSPVGHEGVYRDITERRLAEEALRDSEERYRLMFQEAEAARAVLDRLYRVTSSMQTSWEREDRLRAFEQGVQEALGFDRFYVALASPDLKTFDVTSAVGVEMFESLPLSPAAGPLYHAFHTRRPIAVLNDDDLRRVPLANREYLERPYMRSRRFIVAPLLAGDRVIGVASADNKTTRRPITPVHVELFTLLCQQLATALEEARLYAEARAREQEVAARNRELTEALVQNERLVRELGDKSAQLEVASRHKSEFLANMSHELRTPLNAVIGFADLLLERMFGELNDKQEEYLRDILDSGRHLLSLINDILDLSKIEAGRMELDVTDFQLSHAIENALILVRERAAGRGIALHQTVDARLGAVSGDERKIKQVLLNLLSNAIKFTPKGGRIEVRAAPGDGFVEVSVRDTGVGIAPAEQDAVFEEFRQVGSSAANPEGTALGLG